ncbi:MAG: hypothetical protein QM749_09670 [Aquabacterium sp.]
MTLPRLNRLNGLGIALLALTLPGWLQAPQAFHAAWLTAWWFCLGIVLGALSTGWVHRLSGGAWGHAIAPAVSALAARMPWVLLAALPWVLALPALYGWADTHAAHASLEASGLQGFKHAWLSPGFFQARALCYALCWLGLSSIRPDRAQLSTHLIRQRKGLPAMALLVHALLTSLASVDIVMSLMPRWYSTGFGLVMLMSQGLGGCAMLICWTDDAALRRVPPDESGQHKAPVSRDLGNLLLMYVMSWGYLAFMQYLIIWAENLPNEIAWYVPRTQTAWLWATYAIVLLQLGVPVMALLFRSLKDQPCRLRAMALLLLLANALYCTWLIWPSLPWSDANGWWLTPLTLLGLSLALFAPPARSAPVHEEFAHARA